MQARSCRRVELSKTQVSEPSEGGHARQEVDPLQNGDRVPERPDPQLAKQPNDTERKAQRQGAPAHEDAQQPKQFTRLDLEGFFRLGEPRGSGWTAPLLLGHDPVDLGTQA